MGISYIISYRRSHLSAEVALVAVMPWRFGGENFFRDSMGFFLSNTGHKIWAFLQDGAPKIAKLVYKWFNCGLW